VRFRDEPLADEKRWADEHRRLMKALPSPDTPGWAHSVLALPQGHAPWGEDRLAIQAIAALDARLRLLELEPRVGAVEIVRNTGSGQVGVGDHE
jgi:hypothetical protein